MAINTDNLVSPRGTTAGGRVNAARAAQIASVAKHPIGQPMANIMLDRNRESAANSLGQQNQPYVPANPNEAKAYSVGASKAQGIVAETGFHEAPTGIRPAVQPAAPTGGITAGVAQLPNPQVTASSAPTQMRPAEVTASSAQTQMRPTGVPAVRPAVDPALSGTHIPAQPQAAIPPRVPETYTGVHAAPAQTAATPPARPALPAPAVNPTAAPVAGITGGAAPAYEPTRYVNGQGQPVPRPGRITSPEGQAWNAQRNAEVVGGGGAPPTPPAGGGGAPPVGGGITGGDFVGPAKPGMAQSARNMINGTTGGLGVAAAALGGAADAGGIESIRSLVTGTPIDDSKITTTEQYAERFGITPGGTGLGQVYKADGTITGDLLPSTGIRALGAASDVGANIPVVGGMIKQGAYRDQPGNMFDATRDAAESGAGLAGLAVGSKGGSAAGKYVGKAIDAGIKLVPKVGKMYKGNLAEKYLGGIGSITGGVGGMTAASKVAGAGVDAVGGVYNKEVGADQPQASPVLDELDLSNGQGSGYITDSKGNRQDYNPKTQQFEGADIGKKGSGTMSIMDGAGQQHQARLGRLDAAFAKYQAAGDLEGMRRVADPDNKDQQTAIGAGIKSAKENGPNVTFIGGREPTGSGNGAYDQAMKDAMALSNPNKRVAALTALARTSMDAQQNERDYGLDMQRYTSDTRRDNRIMNESELRQQDLGLDVASKKRVAGLFDNLQNAKTPDERKAAESALLAAQGKSPSEKYMQVDVPTGETDQYGAPVLQRMVVNPETKEVFDPRGQNASNNKPSAAPQADEGATATFPDGTKKAYKNGQWVNVK